MNVRENAVAPDFPTLNARRRVGGSGQAEHRITIQDNRGYALASPLSLADNNFLVIQGDDACGLTLPRLAASCRLPAIIRDRS